MQKDIIKRVEQTKKWHLLTFMGMLDVSTYGAWKMLLNKVSEMGVDKLLSTTRLFSMVTL